MKFVRYSGKIEKAVELRDGTVLRPDGFVGRPNMRGLTQSEASRYANCFRGENVESMVLKRRDGKFNLFTRIQTPFGGKIKKPELSK